MPMTFVPKRTRGVTSLPHRCRTMDFLVCIGAVKITPAHDPNDFATGKRHNLASINILTPDGAINDCGGHFAGQPRFKASPPLTWLCLFQAP